MFVLLHIWELLQPGPFILRLHLLQWKHINPSFFLAPPHYSLCYTRGFRFRFYVSFSSIVAKSLQLCPTLCDPIDGSPPGSPVPGILQARTLEWAAISFSNAGKWKVKAKSLSRVWLFATPWTAAHQAPPSLGFSRQEHWSGLSFPSPL